MQFIVRKKMILYRENGKFNEPLTTFRAFKRPVCCTRIFFFLHARGKRSLEEEKRIQKLLIRSPQRETQQENCFTFPPPPPPNRTKAPRLRTNYPVPRKREGNKLKGGKANRTVDPLRTHQKIIAPGEEGIREKDSKHRNKCLY